MLKNSEVCILYKKVLALVSSTGLKQIFKIFLKSRHAKYFKISLNNHSTLIRTLLICELNSSCIGLRLPPERYGCLFVAKMYFYIQ